MRGHHGSGQADFKVLRKQSGTKKRGKHRKLAPGRKGGRGRY